MWRKNKGGEGEEKKKKPKLSGKNKNEGVRNGERREQEVEGSKTITMMTRKCKERLRIYFQKDSH